MNKENIRILVVDDLSSMRRVVSAFLAELGYRHISQDDNGNYALATLRREKFDMVVTDWNMPGMTGLELVTEIRNDPDLQHLPVLLITGEARKENILAAAKAGASGYVIKPFSMTVLGEKVERLLMRSGTAG
jgi:two-component system chemotaxis response regulator CheY